jgi:hypothetical protein
MANTAPPFMPPVSKPRGGNPPNPGISLHIIPFDFARKLPFSGSLRNRRSGINAERAGFAGDALDQVENFGLFGVPRRPSASADRLQQQAGFSEEKKGERIGSFGPGSTIRLFRFLFSMQETQDR